MCSRIAGFSGNESQAQETPDLTKLSLEDLMKIEVSGASKYLQKSTEAPASVTIVTSDQIERFGYRTFADILRSVRGFYVKYDRNYSYAGTRGFGRPADYNTRILVLIDGHRLNDNVYDGAYIGTEFPIDVDLIDRVEVIRGPSSSLYGTNAFLAVVNVASGYLYAVSGLISQQADTSSTIQFVNWENVRGKGLDFELEWRSARGLEAHAAHTVQRAVSRTSGDVISNSPRHLTKLHLSIPLGPRKLFGSIEGLYTSRRRTVQGSDLGGFFIVNATLLQRALWRGFDFSLGAYNLFNRHYADTGAEEHVQPEIEQDGRTFRLKLTYRF